MCFPAVIVMRVSKTIVCAMVVDALSFVLCIQWYHFYQDLSSSEAQIAERSVKLMEVKTPIHIRLPDLMQATLNQSPPAKAQQKRLAEMLPIAKQDLKASIDLDPVTGTWQRQPDPTRVESNEPLEEPRVDRGEVVSKSEPKPRQTTPVGDPPPPTITKVAPTLKKNKSVDESLQKEKPPATKKAEAGTETISKFATKTKIAAKEENGCMIEQGVEYADTENWREQNIVSFTDQKTKVAP